MAKVGGDSAKFNTLRDCERKRHTGGNYRSTTHPNSAHAVRGRRSCIVECAVSPPSMAAAAIFPPRGASQLQRSSRCTAHTFFAALRRIAGIRAGDAANPGTPSASAAISFRAASASGTALCRPEPRSSAYPGYAGDLPPHVHRPFCAGVRSLPRG